MARSRQARRKKNRNLYYIVPLIAVILSVSVYLIAIAPPQGRGQNAAMNFNVQISIQYGSLAQNGSRVFQFVIPSGAGEPGLAWNVHTYDRYGIGGYYPLYVDPPSGGRYPGYTQIHVVSTVYHNYTLGDFFAVWGMTLGVNNTINKPATNGWSWSMCVGPQKGSLRPGYWGNETLINYNTITLLYDNTGGCL